MLVLIIVLIVIFLFIFSIIQPKPCGCVNKKTTMKTVIPSKAPIVTTSTALHESFAGGSAENAFDQIDGSYVDSVAQQDIGADTIKNHQQFVADMVGDAQQNVIGRTVAMGDLEVAPLNPWIGIRGRPEAIPSSAIVGNIQIPDINIDDYSKGRKWCN